MFQTIVKRDGREVPYHISKIEAAVAKAMEASGRSASSAPDIALKVEERLRMLYPDNPPSVEDIQDVVERVLMDNGFNMVAKNYILYRAERSRVREMNTRLMKIYEELTFTDSIDSDIKRENGNIDGDTPMGTMLKYGSEGAKEFNEKFILKPEQAKAHREGDIHIHDFDFYTLTTTCTQIDIIKLFSGGFSTGHGYLREPNDIQSYAALACIALQSNQNDQHGGQSIVNFDYGLAIGVAKTFRRKYIEALASACELLTPEAKIDKAAIKAEVERLRDAGISPRLAGCPEAEEALHTLLAEAGIEDEGKRTTLLTYAQRHAVAETDRATYQAMEALIHNLNTMHSRAGAQTPFSSINYGMDTSPEGQMVIKNVLLAQEAGLGFGETPIFPIHIFRVKEGINYRPGEPNYELFRLACRVSAKRLFPNFAFQDAPFNLAYYKEGDPTTEIAYMGCRTRVVSNVYDSSRQTTYGRGNLSFTSINLPRIAIRAKGDIDAFFEDLERKMTLVTGQLYDRFKLISQKTVRNFPFLMGQGVWIDSEKLKPDDSVGEVLKHGTLSVGFIGLAETLVALTGKHHGESVEAQNLGLDIVNFMRKFIDDKCRETGLNWSLLATPAEGLSGRFVRLDRKRFGSIPGVTDREYYTNSFHVPVYYDIKAVDKIRLEAPYHALTNAGHISYVELDGDTAKNVEAFEAVVRWMHDCGVGYGSINHPVDRDPVCGYVGV
ncbi:MAG: anaerobic ribonucleoside triphosphate reductase, partial [Clostridia bacterium]|nr:anaerobic ribonucleoside triphosphate reductase [Clostridia bacterium]